MSGSNEQKAITHTIVKLVALGISMFVFAMFVMPPLYDLFCDFAGLNGKTKGQYEAVESEVDTSRVVTVQFVGTNNSGMPWSFKPEVFSVKAHPGEAVTTNFIAHNPTQEIMVGQAIPSLDPSNATDYFHKTECFCFNKQALAPGEEAKLGLQFIVDLEMPKGVNVITLSYTLFDVTKDSPDFVSSKKLELQSKLEESKKSAKELETNLTTNLTALTL